MSEELATGLAATANEPVADSPTIDTVLDAAFDSPSEPAAGSAPSGDPTPAKQPVAATQPPQTTETPSGVGEPPKERWPSILDNARKKAREDALAEHRDHLEVVAELKRDFPGTLARLLEESAGDPRFSEQITAKAAALLAARGKEAKANAEPEPDLQLTDGTLVYSAEQQRKWHKWNQNQTTAQLSEQFKPLQELTQLIEQRKQQVRDVAQVEATVTTRMSEWTSMPFFKEHKDAIASRQQELYAEMQASAQASGQPFDYANAPFKALSAAYAEVVSTKVVPSLQSQQTDSLVAAAARKRAASSSDPAAAAPARPRRPRTVDEALNQVFDAVAP